MLVSGYHVRPVLAPLLDRLTDTPLIALSIRRCSTVSWNTGDLMATIRRTDDGEEADFSYSGNFLNFPAIDEYLGGSAGTWAKWYDQSGNEHDFENSSAAAQPDYASGKGPIWVAASNQQLYNDDDVFADYPFEVAQRIIPDGSYTGGLACPFSLFQVGQTTVYYSLEVNNAHFPGNAAGNLKARNTTEQASTLNSSIPPDVASVITGQWIADDNRILRVNGVRATANTSTVDFNTSANRLVLGRRRDTLLSYAGEITDTFISDALRSIGDQRQIEALR